jgi:hypothetical protein
MKFWVECVSEAFADARVVASQEQIKTVACWIEGAHDNYGLATGRECIPNPMQADVDALRRKCKSLEADVDRERMFFKKNVAMRRGCRPEDVMIEDDGTAVICR